MGTEVSKTERILRFSPVKQTVFDILTMWYSVIDLKEFRCEIIKDKKVVSKMIGMSVPTLDGKLREEKMFLFGKFIVGIAELTKSTRGGN